MIAQKLTPWGDAGRSCEAAFARLDSTLAEAQAPGTWIEKLK